MASFGEIHSKAESRLIARIANLKEVIGLILLVAVPVYGWVWNTTLRQTAMEAAVHLQRRDFEQANLSEEHDRLRRIERDMEWTRRDVEWIRKTLERWGAAGTTQK